MSQIDIPRPCNFLARVTSYGTAPVAIKRFELTGANMHALRQVYKEAVILGQLSHPNIVQLYGMVVDTGPNAAAAAASYASAPAGSTSPSMAAAASAVGPRSAAEPAAGAAAANGISGGDGSFTDRVGRVSSSSNSQAPNLHGALVMELMQMDLSTYLDHHPDLPLKDR